MNVLIVDDDMLSADGVAQNIDWKSLGILQAYTAYSMKKAMEFFENYQIEILICDIEMPRGNGIELMEWVRENRPGVVCIFLTSYHDFEYARNAVRLHVFEYCLKPCEYEKLSEVILGAVKEVRKNQYSKADEIGRFLEDGSSTVISDIKKYIADNLACDISRNEIAKAVHLSPDYLTSLFRQKTGEGLFEYILRKRIEKSELLLKTTDKPVTEVALLSGFQSISYFSRQFKKLKGCSPQSYRKTR